MSTNVNNFSFLHGLHSCVGVFYPKGSLYPDCINSVYTSRGEYLPVTCLMAFEIARVLASRLRVARPDLSVIVLRYD